MTSVSSDSGVSDILESVQTAIRTLYQWNVQMRPCAYHIDSGTPKTNVFVFLGTGSLRPDGSEYVAPFHHQGTGTINTLVYRFQYC